MGSLRISGGPRARRAVAGAAAGAAVLAASALAQDRQPHGLFDDAQTAAPLAGTWSGVEDTFDLLLTLNPDGSGRADAYDHRTGQHGGQALTWAEEADHLRIAVDGQAEQRYLLERLGADAFRLAGADLALDTQLFRRVTSAAADAVPAAWFAGTWQGSAGMDSLTLVLQPDGRYRATLSGGAGHAGHWTAGPATLTLAPDGGPPVDYRAEVSGGHQLNLSGGDLDGWTAFLARTAMPAPGDPIAGQYVGGDMTLLLERQAGGLSAQVFMRGEPVPADATPVDADTLVLHLPDALGGARQATAFYNGIMLGDGTLALWLEKQAEHPLPPPDGLVGAWHHRYWDGAGITYAFSANGRYLAAQATGDGDAPLVTEGAYSLDGAWLTLDPECAAPATQVVRIGGPQLVLGADASDAATYHFVPDSPALIAAAMAGRDAAAAAEDAAWQVRLALAPVSAGAPVTPPAGAPADPDPSALYAGATVFAAPQAYLWQSDHFYVQMQGEPGVLHAVSDAELVFDQGLAARIDWTLGQYRDSIQLFLYPNGRMFQRIENHAGAVVEAGAVIPTVAAGWARYRIEDGRIVSDAETMDLLRGGRRVRSAELCLDNVAWTAEEAGAR